MSDLPEGWRLSTLGDLIANLPNAMTDGPFGSNLKSAHYRQSGARVIRLQNIGEGVFKPADAFIDMSHFETLRRHEVVEGDLLVASLGEQLPRACLVPGGLGPTIVKADCIRVRLSPLVDPQWILYSLQRPDAKKWAADQIHGVGRQRLGMKAIKAIPVPLPPLDEQRRIVAILEDHLSRLDAGCRSTSAAFEKSSALQGALLSTAFSVRQLEARSGGPVATVSIGDVANVLGGKRLPKGTPWAQQPTAHRYIRATDIKNGVVREDELVFVPDVVWPKIARYTVGEGDVVITIAGTIGSLAVVPPSLAGANLTENAAKIVTDQTRLLSEYLMLYLMSPVGAAQVQSRARATTQAKLALYRIEEIQLPLPVVEVQRETVAELVAVRHELSRLSTQKDPIARKAAGLRRSLLKSAFSGQLTKEFNGV